MLCSHVKHSSLWLGRAPQHLLSRPSSFRGVEKSIRFDVMYTFNNVQMNGWSCSPKHGPDHFTVLKKFFVWMVWNYSKTLRSLAEPCSPKHGPVPFTVLKTFFVWMFCSHVNTLKFMAGTRFSTSSVSAKLISRRWKIVSSWCYADFQQRSNKRMIVLPQTRSNVFHGVEKVFRLDGMKLFKNIRTYGWAVLPQTRPSSFHGVEEPFRLDVLRPLRNIQVYVWAARPNNPVTAQLILRRWIIISFWYYADFQQRSNERMVVLPQTRSMAFHAVEEPFRLDGMKLFKNIRTYGWAVLPQTRPSSFHGVEKPSCMDVLQPDKNIQVNGWAALPNIPCHGPAHFAASKTDFVLMLCRLSKTFKWMDGRAPPNTVQLITRCWKTFSFGW